MNFTIYDSFDLKLYARMSKMAYHATPSTKNEYRYLWSGEQKIWDREPEIFEAVPQSTKDAQMFIAGNDTTLFVIFRGGNIRISKIEDAKKTPFADVIYGKDFLKDRYKGLKVNSIFYQQFNQLKFQLMYAIYNKWNSKQLVFIGYSLGGPLAMLAAACCKAQFKGFKISCITFGSPKVGNKSFSRYFNENIDCSKRVVNGDDLLTKTGGFFYKHVTGELEIGTKSSSYFKRLYGTINDNNVDKYITEIDKLTSDQLQSHTLIMINHRYLNEHKV
jgi:hypothetical protein